MADESLLDDEELLDPSLITEEDAALAALKQERDASNKQALIAQAIGDISTGLASRGRVKNDPAFYEAIRKANEGKVKESMESAQAKAKAKSDAVKAKISQDRHNERIQVGRENNEALLGLRTSADKRAELELKAKLEKDALELADKEAKKKLAQENAASSGQGVLDEVNEAKNLLKDGWFTTGWSGMASEYVPNSSGARLKKRLETIKANLGFDKLQAMRAASPTGGALGSVSENENKALQSALANLDTFQDPKDLQRGLEKVETMYNQIIHGPGAQKEETKIIEGVKYKKVPGGWEPVA